MAKQGTLRFMSLSQAEALQFVKEQSVLSSGTMLYISNQGNTSPDVFFGIGKSLAETPGYKGSTLANVVGLLDGSLTGPHSHPISEVVNLQATLDSKSVIGHDHDTRYYTETEMDGFLANKSDVGHMHAITDVISLDTTLDDLDTRVTTLENNLYTPGVTAVDEGLIT